MSGRRIGRRQLEQLRQQLSARDTQVLWSLHTYRLLRTDHLQTLHFTNHASPDTATRVTRRVLQRLTERNLVVRLQRSIGGIRAGSAGHVYALSPLGYRLLGDDVRKRRHEPSLHHLRHTLAIADIGIALHAHATEHLSSWHIQPEPAAWRSFTNGVGQLMLKPDLAVRLADSDYELSWFIEIDCATESRPTIQRKCRAYTDYRRCGLEQERHGVFPLVLWIAPDQKRATQIETAIQQDRSLDPSLFIVTTTEAALDEILDIQGDRAGQNEPST